MQLENQTITKGAALFFRFTSPQTGKVKYQSGHVIDINEHVKAVKVQFSVGNPKNGKVKSDWKPLADLFWSAPKEEEVTK